MVEVEKNANNPISAVRKAARLLTVLSEAGSAGLELRELSQRCMLPKATAHRLLAVLLDEQLLQRVPQTRRYRHAHVQFDNIQSAPR
ncbi:helix-turn-helix domain-containing protein [Acetobacter sp. DsW_063]|uniref:helix-turn-helix domain-containing protein n=1 Tax=Acetobacter sp. DsW_063 TaxID=1514894 RepID=UPI000A363506|nr:helix-turn-helix domain-containing protein [Acetobacter sp. DsW_063]OUJ14813.1 hypothetical protein HK28_11315 [Acetobacter sp. DsW_063]